jgi:hypothetical protein
MRYLKIFVAKVNFPIQLLVDCIVLVIAIEVVLFCIALLILGVCVRVFDLHPLPIVFIERMC